MDYLFLGAGATSLFGSCHGLNCSGTFTCFSPFGCSGNFVCNIFNRVTPPCQSLGGGCPSNVSGPIPLGNKLSG